MQHYETKPLIIQKAEKVLAANFDLDNVPFKEK